MKIEAFPVRGSVQRDFFQGRIFFSYVLQQKPKQGRRNAFVLIIPFRKSQIDEYGGEVEHLGRSKLNTFVAED